MSEEQQRFDDLMKRVIKVTPEELRRRLKEEKTAKETAKIPAKENVHGT
jgi:DNA-binding HxlR family transcriptional regulator